MAIKISDRNKMDPHTHEREVAITGTYASIQLACAMIGEKLAQNKSGGGAMGSMGGGGGGGLVGGFGRLSMANSDGLLLEEDVGPEVEGGAGGGHFM